MNDIEYAKIIRGIQNIKMSDQEKEMVEQTIEEERSNMTLEQYEGIKAALDNAQNSTVPFAVVNDDELAVVGDANKTELKRFEYEITFERPEYDAAGNLTGEFDVETKKYENVFVKPRMNTRIVKLIASILPYFYKVDEDGNQVEYSKIELIQIFGRIDGAILDLMYELVATILDIPAGEIDYMTGTSVINTIMKFIDDNPQTAREAQLFFS